MNNLPKNYFVYHFTVALASFVKSRPHKLAAEFEFLNIASFAKNLFAPYRRLAKSKKASLLDRLSFNLISRSIGAVVRLLLIILGLFLLSVFAFAYFWEIIFYILPVLSVPQYFSYRRHTFFEKDLADPKKFMAKLQRSKFFQSLTLFFEDDLATLFHSLPTPETIGVNTNQNFAEMLSTYAHNWPGLKSYLAQQNINAQEFNILTQYLDKFYQTPVPAKPSPIGYELIYGYTNTLDSYSSELTSQEVTSPYFNKALVENLEKVLTKIKNNNALLIGEVGVGRHSGIIDLAAAVTRRQLPTLNDKRILLIDTIALLSSSKNLIDIKAKFEQLLEEAKYAGNIILVIDQVDRIASSLDGRIDLSEILEAVLNNNALPVIGITTYDDFNKYIRLNPQLLRLFEKVEVLEPQKDQTLQILIGKNLELHHKTKMSVMYQALLEIVEKSEKLIADKMQPEKSILILEDTIARAQKLGQNQITLEIVDEILSEKTKIPIGKISEAEIEKLKDLEGFLHRRIVGQDEAIVAIAKAMRRSRTGLERGKRPMGSFLFLGPTGVGKTETAKALADAFFGSDAKMIRLDMTEYREEGSIKRLIGDLETKTPGQLTSLVLSNPYGLLLVDEFEKANPYVQNLFLQIIDEGSLNDAFGKKVSFTNIIIISTSNAGAEFIREEVARGATRDLSQKLLEYVLSKGLFNPELVNRFDAVIVYQPLTQEEIVKVSKLELAKLAAEIKETKNITLEISDDLAKKVAKEGYNIEFGARPIRRLIQDKIEDGIAKMIIRNQVASGGIVPAQILLGFVS